MRSRHHRYLWLFPRALATRLVVVVVALVLAAHFSTTVNGKLVVRIRCASGLYMRSSHVAQGKSQPFSTSSQPWNVHRFWFSQLILMYGASHGCACARRLPICLTVWHISH